MFTGGTNADPDALDSDGNDWERFSERLKELCPLLINVEYTPFRLPMCGMYRTYLGFLIVDFSNMSNLKGHAANLERLKRRDYL